jgi:hypothetical protein
MRALTKKEQEHNNTLKFLGLKTYRITDYDRARKKALLYFGIKDMKIIDLAYFSFLPNNQPLEVELSDTILWRKCTNDFFGLEFEIYPEGRKLLSILTSNEYCSMNEKYKDRWKEFIEYYQDTSSTIDYIKSNLFSTWKKLTKEDKSKKVKMLNNTLPFGFDKYNYLKDYGINQQKKALLKKLNSLELRNLHENNIYMDSYRNITKSKEKKYYSFISTKIKNLFIDYFIKYHSEYKIK